MKLLLILAMTVVHVTAAENWNTTIDASTIFQVCDIHDVKITFGNNTPPYCPKLPVVRSAGDFFNQNRAVFEVKCTDQTQDEPQSRRPTVWDRSVRALHSLVSGVRSKIEAFTAFAASAALDIAEASLITRRWHVFWYFIASSTVSAIFFCQGFTISRPGKLKFNIVLNIIIGFLLTATFYCCHLYFYNVWMMGVLAAIALFCFSPIYPSTYLSGLGLFTLIELFIPMLGMLARFYLNTNLFFGPFLSLVINLGGLLVQSLCFVALYIDEKLMVVKLFFLPFYQICQRIFTSSQRAGQTVRLMQSEAESITRSIFTAMDISPPDDLTGLQRIDKAMTDALSMACKTRTMRFMGVCYSFVRKQCLETAWNVDPMAYVVATFMCGNAALESCSVMRSKTVDQLDSFCRVQNQSAFGFVYNSLQEQLNDLHRQIVIDPLAPKVNPDILEATTGFDLLAASWTWWVARALRWGMAAFCLAVLFVAFIQAVSFLYKYYSDVYFCNNYLSYTKIEEEWRIKLTRKEQTKYYGSFAQAVWDLILFIYRQPQRYSQSVRPLVYTLVCWSVEKLAFKVHQLMDCMNFVVPELGDSRFTFNVQGSGMLALQLRLILGGFSIQSKYCKVVDSYACKTAFLPVDWQEYMKLLTVAFFYFAIGVFQSRSDYLMCRLADFFIPSQGEKRAEVILEDILFERQKRMKIISNMAIEEFEDPVFDKTQNDLIIRFYLPRRWYHRFFPTLGLQLIAYFVYGIDNILCQVCGSSIVEARFRCRNLLMCEECVMYVRQCPCGSDLCKDNKAFPV